MRSYYSHLDAIKKAKEKPYVLRASSLFPVWQQAGLSTRLLFMGYWFVKRHIQRIAQQLVLRNSQGVLLLRTALEELQAAKAYRIELSTLLEQAEWQSDAPFEGSIELSFHSLVDLVFPFPAVVVNYYGKEFSSVVHTAERVYNDFDDWKANSASQVGEGGFNIYAKEELHPFVALVNGPEEMGQESELPITFYNKQGESYATHYLLPPLEPYAMHRVLLKELLSDKRDFLGDGVGTVKLHCPLPWVFPRLLAGNFVELPGADPEQAMVVTHSYYDCTDAIKASDYWNKAPETAYDAVLMIPLCVSKGWFTTIYFYPLYSPTRFSLDLEVYNSEGTLVARIPSLGHFTSDRFLPLSLAPFLLRSLPLVEERLAARLLVRTDADAQLPSRIKIGVDIGHEAGHLPCNICTNLQVYNPQLETKKSSFKWAPLLFDQPGGEAWIMSSHPKQPFDETASVELTFFREADEATIQRKKRIPANGFLYLNQDEELAAFFGNSIGWFTAITSNPYTTGYYFNRRTDGGLCIGGDHVF